MANAEKTALIEDLAGKFRDSSGAVLTEYRGLTVAQMSELRGALKGNATFTVTKNTLAKVAATEAGLGDQVSPMLSGPSAIAFVDGDVAQAAKGLLDFAKANPLLLKGGVSTARRSARPRSASSPTWSRARCCWPSWPAR